MSAQRKTAEKGSGNVKIKWVVSFIGCTDDMRQTIRGLGLRRLHQVVERQDTPAVRGMIHKVRHLFVGHKPVQAIAANEDAVARPQLQRLIGKIGFRLLFHAQRRGEHVTVGMHRGFLRRICIRPQAHVSARFAWAGASGPSSAKPRAPATRDRSPAAAIRAGGDLKAARCRCTGAFRSAASTICLGSPIRW